jgi:O-antigen ligase
MEIREAWPQVADSPWLGLGIGAVYRWEEAWDDAAQVHYMRAVTYMHNGYMLLLTGAGFLGLVAGLMMYAVFFYRAIKIYGMMRNPRDQAIVLSCIASVASIMIGAVMQPTIAASHDTPMVAAMFGIVELLRYFRMKEASQEVLASTAGGAL